MEEKKIYTIPQSYDERQRLRNVIAHFVSSLALVPPLTMNELSDFAERLIGEHGLDASIKGWLMVEIHNQAWRETVLSIPYDKRILLLPKCLSNSKKCTAAVDELGLLCNRCGSCSIPNLQDKADSLGVMSMVAEGFTSVIELVENRVVDAVIGVGCLDSLEKVFPLLINHAVPGLAIPLNVAGCKDTEVDYEYVEQLISTQSDKEANLSDYDGLKSTVREWFGKEKLAALFSSSPLQGNSSSSIALDWLSGDGKRWRPYLLVSTYLALTEKQEILEEVQLAAIAVECFHKASLVHDDIQDNDTQRYGKQTVHSAYGSSVAINVGDMLLGEGYRLLTSCGSMELMKIAADAHIALCKGQGMELEWSDNPRRLTMDFVLDIFRNKTVPAFDVALTMGAICANGDAQLQAALHRYAQAMGVAYQLQDDVEDFDTDEPLTLRPSAVLAAICEQQADEDFIGRLLKYDDVKAFLHLPENKNLLDKAIARVQQMAEQHHKEALESLRELRSVELKRLLFRVTQRILKKHVA
jgi:geranylgeranyl pyrophosphate synthase